MSEWWEREREREREKQKRRKDQPTKKKNPTISDNQSPLVLLLLVVVKIAAMEWCSTDRSSKKDRKVLKSRESTKIESNRFFSSFFFDVYKMATQDKMIGLFFCKKKKSTTIQRKPQRFSFFCH